MSLGIGLWLVVPARGRRDPLEAVRIVIVAQPSTERLERVAVILVRLLGILNPVDSEDDILASLLPLPAPIMWTGEKSVSPLFNIRHFSCYGLLMTFSNCKIFWHLARQYINDSNVVNQYIYSGGCKYHIMVTEGSFPNNRRTGSQGYSGNS